MDPRGLATMRVMAGGNLFFCMMNVMGRWLDDGSATGAGLPLRRLEIDPTPREDRVLLAKMAFASTTGSGFRSSFHNMSFLLGHVKLGL